MDQFLIIRLSSLGDIIHALPAFAALRKAFPQARIRWAVEKKGGEILDLVPGIDEVIVVGKKRWQRSLREMKQRDQIALDFQGLVKSALWAFLSRSRRRIGFSRQNLKEPMASLFYTECASPTPEEEVHVIQKNLRLLERLGVRETRLEFPLRIPEAIDRSVRSKLSTLGRKEGQRIAVFNMGAAWESKRWFPEKWSEFMAKAALKDCFPVLLWGSDDEKSLAETVAQKTGVPLAPFFSIPEVIALVKTASLVVSGDSFALQAACALDVPAVALFGPTNPLRNGPFRARDKVLYARRRCSPCYKHECPTLDCLKAISAEEVAEAAQTLWQING